MLFQTSGLVHVLLLAAESRRPARRRPALVRRPSSSRPRLAGGAMALAVTCGALKLPQADADAHRARIGGPATLTKIQPAQAVEPGPGERVAGMMERLPIRPQGIVCSATLREERACGVLNLMPALRAAHLRSKAGVPT